MRPRGAQASITALDGCGQPSDRSVRPVVALLGAHTLSQRVARALPRGVSIVACDSEGAFRRAIDVEDAAVAVLDVEDAARRGRDGLIREMRFRHPHLVMLGIRGLSPGASRDAWDAVRAGVHELVLDGLDDLGAATRLALDVAEQHGLLRRAERAGLRFNDVHVQAFFAFCLHNADRSVGVEQAARATGVSRRTLARRLRAAGAPSASYIAGWARVLFAACLFEDRAKSVEQVAYEASWDSPSAMRNMLRRYLSVQPTELRALGAFRFTASRFRRAMGPLLLARSPLAEEPEEAHDLAEA